MKPLPKSDTLSPQLIAMLDADDSVKSNIMKKALEKIKSDAEAKDIARTIEQIDQGNRILAGYVTKVRDIRKQERAAVAKLKAYNTAFEAFKQSGDSETFRAESMKIAIMP